MNKKTLALTLGAAAVVTGIGVLMSNSQQASSDMQTSLVLPQLAEKANHLERIKIETAGNTLVVESHKEGDKWLIDNLGNYTAETKSLSTLINNLKDAKKVEPKTTKPKLFHHLGLRDISDSESKATLVTLTAGEQSYQLLVGDSAKNGAGQYVRLAGDNQTWLIDKSISKPDSAEDWINTKLFDFTINDIKNVNLSGKFSYSLTKADKEQASFTLKHIPETHKLKYDSIVDVVPRALSNLSFDSLIKLTDLPELSDSQTLTVTLFDNDSTIDVEVAKTKVDEGAEGESKYYAKLTGNNPLWQQWAYEISEYNYGQLAKDKSDYLDEKEPEVEPATESDTP